MTGEQARAVMRTVRDTLHCEAAIRDTDPEPLDDDEAVALVGDWLAAQESLRIACKVARAAV